MSVLSDCKDYCAHGGLLQEGFLSSAVKLSLHQIPNHDFHLPCLFLPPLDRNTAAQFSSTEDKSSYCSISQEKMKLNGAEDGDMVLDTDLLR